jgi:hypothetical protein
LSTVRVVVLVRWLLSVFVVLRLLLSVVLRLLLSVLVVLRSLLSVFMTLRLLLSVFVVLRSLLSVDVFVVLRLLLSVLDMVDVLPVLLMSVFVVSALRVLVWVTVLPPRPTTESSAWALREKASEMAVTSKVLFIRVPLWVLVGGRSAVCRHDVYRITRATVTVVLAKSLFRLTLSASSYVPTRHTLARFAEIDEKLCHLWHTCVTLG